MYVLKEHINHLFHEAFYEKMKKLLNFLTVSSIFYKKFSKMDD